MRWKAVLSPDDAQELMRLFGGFHDACVREMHLHTGHSVSPELFMRCTGELDTVLRVLIQRQFRDPSAIEMLFEQVTRLNLVPTPENYDSIIFGATLIQHNGEWLWSPEQGWSPDDADRDQCSWVSARRLSWRDASEWMGQELRYGPRLEADGA
jgi:hypothetical protein